MPSLEVRFHFDPPPKYKPTAAVMRGEDFVWWCVNVAISVHAFVGFWIFFAIGMFGDWTWQVSLAQWLCYFYWFVAVKWARQDYFRMKFWAWCVEFKDWCEKYNLPVSEEMRAVIRGER